MCAWLSLLVPGCSGAPPPATGRWVLSAPEARGVLELRRSSCAIALWGAGWELGGPAPVDCTWERDAGGCWLRFPFQTGAGAGNAQAMWTDVGLLLPLGAREGEMDVSLERREGWLDAETRRRLAGDSARSLASWRAAWADGRFRLEDGGRLSGELDLGAGEIAVYDASWMTEGRVSFRRQEEGPDLLLSFPVQPSLRGELGLLRVNRPAAVALVPLGSEPSSSERRLALVPGLPGAAERQAARRDAIETAEREEREIALPVAMSLAAAAGATGRCALDAIAERSSVLLAGYEVAVAGDPPDCELAIEPEPVQHRRRLSARVRAGEVIEAVTRPLR